MSQSLVQVYIHLIFSTQNRTPFLQKLELRDQLHRYLAGACKNLGSPAVIVGGVEDHVHILCRFGKGERISDLIRELKRESSKWLKLEEDNLKDFHWQKGYGAFSVSPAHVDALRGYIEQQEEHHRKESFQGELRRLCQKYGVAIDERYVWE